MAEINVSKKNRNLTGDMPHSLEAEQALLGCLLLDTKIQVEVASSLSEEDFYAESHKYIFGAMYELIKNNQPVDLVTLTDLLEKEGTLEQTGGISYITGLIDIMPSTANYKIYLDIVLRDSMLRRLILGSSEIIKECQGSTDKEASLAFAEKKIFDISETADNSEMVKIGAVIPEVINKFDELSKDKSAYRGIKTKFRDLDRILNGLHGSDLMILAARPAVGKTSFAMNIVENLALQGYTCAVFSLEMGKDQLVQRMICSVAGVNMGNALRGQMNRTEWLKVAKAREMLANTKIYIDDSSLVTPQEVLSKCRRLKRKTGALDFVMIDYIQLMNGSGKKNEDNRQQEISNISRNLKIMAKELNVPVLALSQLSRAVEARKGRPQLSDLRESGAIEQDADIVMFIHRPDKNASEKELAEGKIKQNVAEIIIEKHRNGSQGTVELYFKGECTKFLNLNSDTGEPEDEEQKQNRAVNTGYASLPENHSKSVEDATDSYGENPPLPEEAPPDDLDGLDPIDTNIFG